MPILSICVMLTACSAVAQVATGKAAELALNAIGIKLPENTNAPRPPKTVNLRLIAANDLNASEDGQGLSAIVRLYKLKDHNNFLSAPYSTLGHLETEKQAMDVDLIETRELTLSPGHTLDLKEKIPSDAAYLGIVTLFRSPYPQRWRYVFATSEAEKSGVTLGVHRCAMTVTNIAPIGMALSEAALLSSVKCK